MCPFGLSDEDGEFELFVPVYNGKVMSGLASLDYDKAHDWLNADRVFGFDPERLVIEQHRVRVRRLDDLGLAPDLIKMDVQGLEEKVIRGGLRTIAEHRPVLMVEALTKSCDALLRGHGYEVRRGKENLLYLPR